MNHGRRKDPTHAGDAGGHGHFEGLLLRHLGTGSGHRLAQHHDMIDEARLLRGSYRPTGADRHFWLARSGNDYVIRQTRKPEIFPTGHFGRQDEMDVFAEHSTDVPIQHRFDPYTQNGGSVLGTLPAKH